MDLQRYSLQSQTTLGCFRGFVVEEEISSKHSFLCFVVTEMLVLFVVFMFVVGWRVMSPPCAFFELTALLHAIANDPRL